MQDIILLFTKYPLPGRSKTRLIPALGAKGAADLQRAMTTGILATIQTYCETRVCMLEVHHDGGNRELMKEWLGGEIRFIQQQGDDLGARMASAISPHLSTASTILLVGSDCPDIDETVLSSAHRALRRHPLVLGPAYDGGYYLIGVRGGLAAAQLSHLFSAIAWGAGDVLRQTTDRAAELGFSYSLTRKIHDIDTPEDLRHINYRPDAQ